MAIHPSDRRRGARIEALFQAWLDRDEVPYVYFDQSQLSVPATLRGAIKRPDFAIGLPHLGTLAFDVKAKSVYNGHVLIDC